MADRLTPFSYRCNACNRCCHNKRIQLNPYEIARLARNRSMDSGTFIVSYTDDGGTVLKWGEGDACVFLSERGCTVHPDRPLVCRVYPLGRLVQPDGSESFGELEPDPETKGDYGKDGSIAGYLAQQGAAPYMAAADMYLAFLHERIAAMQKQIADGAYAGGDIIDQLSASLDDGEPVHWYDIDRIVADHATRTGQALPTSPIDKMAMHLEAVRALAASIDENA